MKLDSMQISKYAYLWTTFIPNISFKWLNILNALNRHILQRKT